MSDEKTQNGSAPPPDSAGVKNLLMSANWEDQLREARARREKVLSNKRTPDPSSRPKPWENGPSLKEGSQAQIDETLLASGVKRRARPGVKRREQPKPASASVAPPTEARQPDPPAPQPAPLPPLVPASEPLVEAVAPEAAAVQPERRTRLGLIAACMFVVGTTLGAGVAWQVAQPTSAAPANSLSGTNSAASAPTTVAVAPDPVPPSEASPDESVIAAAPELQSTPPLGASVPVPGDLPRLARTADMPEPGSTVPGMLAPVLAEAPNAAVVSPGPQILEIIAMQPLVEPDVAPILVRFGTRESGTTQRAMPVRLAALAPDFALTLREESTIAALQQAPRLPLLTTAIAAPERPTTAAAPRAEGAPLQLAAASPGAAITSHAGSLGASVETNLRVAFAPPAIEPNGAVSQSFSTPGRAGVPGLRTAPFAEVAPEIPAAPSRVTQWAGVPAPASPLLQQGGAVEHAAPATELQKVAPESPAPVRLAAKETALPNVLEYARILVLNNVDGLTGIDSTVGTNVIGSSQPPAPRPIPVAVQPGLLPDATVAALAPLPRPVVKPTFESAYVRVHAPTAVESDKVEAVMAQVSESGVGLVELKRVELKISKDNVRYFHAEDAEAAAAVAEATGAVLRNFTAFSPLPPSGSIEYWVAGTRKGGGAAAVATRTPQRATPQRTTTQRRAVTVTRSAPSAEERRLRAVQQRIIQRLRRGNAF